MPGCGGQGSSNEDYANFANTLSSRGSSGRFPSPAPGRR